MKISVVTIGKLKGSSLQSLASEYIERIGHYSPFEFVNFKSEEAFLKKLTPDDFLVVMDERGREMVSQDLANFIEERGVRSTKRLVFAIGPGEGFSEQVKRKGDLNLALSQFTLQHDMALVVLLEQIYRAFTIIRGEPYHK